MKYTSTVAAGTFGAADTVRAAGMFVAALIFAVAAPSGAHAQIGDGLTAEGLIAQRFAGEEMFGTRGTYTELGIGLRYDAPIGLYASLDLRARSDDRYGSPLWVEDGPVYFELREGGFGYDGELISARAGRFPHSDVVDSPYALFISGRERSAFIYEIDYEGDWLRILTRSITLNRNSVHGYPDRSAIFQTVAIRRPGWEVGFQDATVAVGKPRADGERPSDGTGPVFVPEFFFVPLPSYVNQRILRSGENPWLQDINFKSMMGFYAVVRSETTGGLRWETEGQILFDDFNTNAIFQPQEWQNPFIGGWMLSGKVDSPLGAFRLSHAGTLAYLFQTSSERRYSYTYYPEVTFPLGGELQVIDYRDNYVGFYLGENTAAVRLDWERHIEPNLERPRVDRVSIDASGEYTVSGSKSPLNPWTEYDDWREHGEEWPFGSTRFLGEDPLEHGLLFGAGVETRIPAGTGALIPRIEATAGVWYNVLRLTPLTRGPGDDFPPSGQVEFYRPSDETFAQAALTLSARYRF